ncbi:hypothetical protein [Streptomyces sp. TLI_146]|uniref:hypothetical protein n=1 Tax=Streptomyces sp. TLI_146 TaxID=1938858 RepID=UPI001180FABE|nr:hypothetical protein [Streptomyces sp. TLI_146]
MLYLEGSITWPLQKSLHHPRPQTRPRNGQAPPGAHPWQVSGWLIPVEDLLAAGFRLNAPAGPDPDPSPAAVVERADHHQEHGVDADELRTELERTRSKLVEEPHGQELAEADAQGAARAAGPAPGTRRRPPRALAALMPAPERTQLTAAPPVVPGQGRPGTAVSADAGGEEPRRRWWGGRR